MGRLIDADKLKNDLNKRCATDCNVCSHYRLAQEESRLFGYCGLIDEQPTAYDVDKVVEEFESRKILLFNGRYDVDLNTTLNEEIEIVKKGGK